MHPTLLPLFPFLFLPAQMRTLEEGREVWTPNLQAQYLEVMTMCDARLFRSVFRTGRVPKWIVFNPCRIKRKIIKDSANFRCSK